MRSALSNSVRPAETMRPESGAMRPAMHCRVSVFPEPDGPTSATIGWSLVQAASSVKSPNCFACGDAQHQKRRRAARPSASIRDRTMPMLKSDRTLA